MALNVAHPYHPTHNNIIQNSTETFSHATPTHANENHANETSTHHPAHHPTHPCCICLTERPLVCALPLEVAPYTVLQPHLTKGRLADHWCVLPSGCGRRAHAVCVACVRTMFSGTDVYEPVLRGFARGHVCGVCWDGGDALEGSGGQQKSSVPGSSAKKWLHFCLDASEYRVFEQRLRRVTRPESVFIPCRNMCPINIPIHSSQTEQSTQPQQGRQLDRITQWVECPFDIEVSRRAWEHHRKGDLVIQCASAFCRHRRCADCQWPVPYGATLCGRCRDEEDDACEVNPLMWSAAHKRGMYPSEITPGAVLAHLCDILTDEAARVTCPGCGVKIAKTVDCNSISHCGYHFCYVCRAVTSAPFLPVSHWDGQGRTGCPRWDSDPYWNGAAGCGFSCGDGCASHDTPCGRKEHTAGRARMDAERKRWAAWALLRSLEPGVVRALWPLKHVGKARLPHHPRFIDLVGLEAAVRDGVYGRAMAVTL